MKSIPSMAVLLCGLSAMLFGCSRDNDLADRGAPRTRTDSPTPVVDSALDHFWFDYNHQPNPGKRVWMRTSDDIWAELYPNGTISRYKRSARGRLNGEVGTVVRKFEGDITQTLVPNDGSFEAFFPDRTATNRVLFYRYLRGTKWGAWRALAPVNPIE